MFGKSLFFTYLYSCITHTQVTGEEFGLFQRRHHCRLTGNLCVDAASNIRLPLPDLGYEMPERVSDPTLGLFSVHIQ